MKTKLLNIVFVIIIALLAIFFTKANNEIELIRYELNKTSDELESNQYEIDVLNTSLEDTTDKLNETKNELKEKEEEIKQLEDDMLDIQENMYNSDNAIGIVVNSRDVKMIAQTVYGEANGLSTMEKSAVIWSILNRVDSGYWGDTIYDVITYPGQFHGYENCKYVDVDQEYIDLAIDVLTRWQMEKMCIGDVGRTLPKEYLFFAAYEGHNLFRDVYESNCKFWDWNCENPYE